MPSGSFWADNITASGVIAGALDSKINADKVGVYNVVYYGADPSGVASSVTAIQNANDDAAAGAGGGIVYFPPGSYSILSNVNPSSNTYWYGPGATLFSGADSPHNLLSNNGTLSNLTIYGLTFDLNTHSASAIFLSALSSTDITLERITVKNGGGTPTTSAVLIGKVYDTTPPNPPDFIDYHSKRIRAINCDFVSVDCASFEALEFVSCDDSVITGCTFSNCTGNAALGIYGYCNGVTASFCMFDGNDSEFFIILGQNINVIGCAINGSPSTNIGSQLINVANVNITGNTFLGVGSSTCWIQFDKNNNVDGHSIQFLNSNAILFESNIFSTYSVGIEPAFHPGGGIYNISPTNFLVRNNIFNGVTTPIIIAHFSSSATYDFSGNRSYNPTGYQSTGPQPVSTGTNVPNPFPFACQVTVSGGTVQNIGISQNTGLTSGTFTVAVGGVINVTYTGSVVPTFAWFGL
jgi:hypothetical protein